ncbi:MAG: hypothetical protein FWC15_02540 [Fibromonadales bacterium]|nr:hypothetical protein [Fibromonadales bacterium]
MTLYMALFFLGFMLAISLLAYASMQVVELNKQAEAFGKDLEERYSKPLASLEELIKHSDEHVENMENTENAHV